MVSAEACHQNTSRTEKDCKKRRVNKAWTARCENECTKRITLAMVVTKVKVRERDSVKEEMCLLQQEVLNTQKMGTRVSFT